MLIITASANSYVDVKCGVNQFMPSLDILICDKIFLIESGILVKYVYYDYEIIQTTHGHEEKTTYWSR